MGLAWANCVNSRLFVRPEEILGKARDLVDEQGGDFVARRIRRSINVTFAPHLPSSSCEFVISKEGVSCVHI